MLPKRRDGARSACEFRSDLKSCSRGFWHCGPWRGSRRPCRLVISPRSDLGYELHPFLVSSEGRQERGVFLGLLLKLNVAAEILAEADLDDDEGAFFLVEGGRVGGESV